MPDQRKQKTPTGHEIPVPTRKDFEDALDKVAKPAAAKKSRRRPKK